MKDLHARIFAGEVVRLNANDYVQFTSMKDFRYYDYCSPAMRYNWRFRRFWNIPLDKMMDVVDCTLKSGHAVLWLCYSSDPGFNYEGDLIGHPEVTEEYRMESIRTLSTTDDRIMHIIGTAHDRDGRKYYIVKNCCGEPNTMGTSSLAKATFRIPGIRDGQDHRHTREQGRGKEGKGEGKVAA